jgi:hypothetical protein
VGEPLAEALGAPLSLVLVRKLPIPISPEMGFGAVTIDGTSILNERVVSEYRLSKQEIEAITQRVQEEVIRRAKEYLGNGWKPEVGGWTYTVDDGLATGAQRDSRCIDDPEARTQDDRAMRACVACYLRRRGPAALMRSTALLLREAFAVASFYEDFHEMTDDEVREVSNDDERMTRIMTKRQCFTAEIAENAEKTFYRLLIQLGPDQIFTWHFCIGLDSLPVKDLVLFYFSLRSRRTAVNHSFR